LKIYGAYVAFSSDVSVVAMLVLFREGMKE
jgi:hypothetical protein